MLKHIFLFFAFFVSFSLLLLSLTHSPPTTKIYVWLECLAVVFVLLPHCGYYCSRSRCCYYCCFSQLFFLLLLLSRSLLHKNLTKDLNPKVNKLWWKRTHKIFCTLKFVVQLDGGWTFLFAHMEIFAVNYQAAAERETDTELGWANKGHRLCISLFFVCRVKIVYVLV